MKFLKILGLTSGLMPVLYCIQLIFSVPDVMEFLDPDGKGGWWGRASTSGLAPAVIGLGAVGLVFAIAFILKLVGALRSQPAHATGSVRSEPLTTESDADAMIARYLAKQAGPAPAPRTGRSLPPAPAGSFGRKAV